MVEPDWYRPGGTALEDSLDTLKSLLWGKRLHWRSEDMILQGEQWETLVEGRAEGVLIGGNLTVLASMCGSPDLPLFPSMVLVLEDINEAPYRLDRSFQQLIQAGLGESVRGLILGDFLGFEGGQVPTDLIKDWLRFLPPGIPVLSGFPTGHRQPVLPLPLGSRVRLECDPSQWSLEWD